MRLERFAPTEYVVWSRNLINLLHTGLNLTSMHQEGTVPARNKVSVPRFSF